MKKLLVLMLALTVIIPGYSQDKEKEKKEEAPAPAASTEKMETPLVDTKAYTEITLEDFETTQFDKKNLSFGITRNQEGDLAIRDQAPAPNGKSKKYLGVKAFGRNGDTFTIKPAKDLIIDKYCREISVWVYGKKFSGELSFLLQDAMQNNHRLILGKLNFLGWRKLVVKITKEIAQEDNLLSQKRFLKILQFQYRPGNITQTPIWHYFYIDDINAMVREKYTDNQSDEW